MSFSLLILNTDCLPAQKAFYTETLGFEEIGRMAGPDGNLIFGNIKWKEVHIMFGSTAWLPPEAVPHRGAGVDFYITGQAEDDIDQFYHNTVFSMKPIWATPPV